MLIACWAQELISCQVSAQRRGGLLLLPFEKLRENSSKPCQKMIFDDGYDLNTCHLLCQRECICFRHRFFSVNRRYSSMQLTMLQNNFVFKTNTCREPIEFKIVYSGLKCAYPVVEFVVERVCVGNKKILKSGKMWQAGGNSTTINSMENCSVVGFSITLCRKMFSRFYLHRAYATYPDHYEKPHLEFQL